MGISNREYMRDDEPGYSQWRGSTGRGNPQSMVKSLIIANVIVYIAQLATRHGIEGYFIGSLVEDWLALDPQDLLRGQVWRLFTYDFLHSTGSPFHILFNMLILYMAGSRVEDRYGSREFLTLYLAAGFLSGLVFLVWGFATRTPSGVIGASGAVTAILLIYALHWPHERWLFMMIFPMPVIVIVMIAMAFDIFPLLAQLSGRPNQDGIAHAAHLGGWAFGYLYFKNQWRISDWLTGMRFLSLKKLFRRRPRVRIHRPDEDRSSSRQNQLSLADSARLDQLLAKIQEKGEASLTDEEREFLARTSRHFRERP